MSDEQGQVEAVLAELGIAFPIRNEITIAKKLIEARVERDEAREERDALRENWSGLLIEQANLLRMREEAIQLRDEARKEITRLSELLALK